MLVERGNGGVNRRLTDAKQDMHFTEEIVADSQGNGFLADFQAACRLTV